MQGYNRSKPDDERNPESLAVRGCRQIFNGAYLVTIDRDVQSLVYDIETLLDIAKIGIVQRGLSKICKYRAEQCA